MVFLSRNLPSWPRIFCVEGRVASHSTSLWSISGSRTSRRVGHAGAVDLGDDVADQIGLEIEVLDQGQGVRESALRHVPAKTARES